MRVAYVSYADYGGPLVHTREFVRAFATIVPELVVCCPHIDREGIYARASSETPMNRLFAHFPHWARQLKLELYQFRKLLNEYGKRHEYGALFQKSRLDIVIIRYDAFVFGPVWAAVQNNLPYLLEVNGMLTKHSPDRITRWFEKYVLTHASGIFTVTDSLARLLVDAGASPDKVRIITNGVSIERFAESDGDGAAESVKNKLAGAIVIGYVGTFADYHDTKLLMDSFAIARKKVDNLRMVLVGEGRNDQLMKDYAAQRNLQGHVFFTGKVSHDSVPDYLKIFDIAVNPVRKIYEEDFHVAPIKIFEYMAAALPIVSTDMPNLKRLLGDSLVFVPDDRPDSWAEVFVSLAKSEAMRRQMGDAAYRCLIEKEFTWHGNARRIYRFCKDILQRSVNRGNGN